MSFDFPATVDLKDGRQVDCLVEASVEPGWGEPDIITIERAVIDEGPDKGAEVILASLSDDALASLDETAALAFEEYDAGMRADAAELRYELIMERSNG